jgi:hypothetical protein
LFCGWKIGISLPLFFLALGLGAVARNRIYAPRRVHLVLESHRKLVPALLRTMDLRFPDAQNFFARPENWQAWSFRAWRIERYLANNPGTPSGLSNRNKG